jgi:hypothetical protein
MLVEVLIALRHITHLVNLVKGVLCHQTSDGKQTEQYYD